MAAGGGRDAQGGRGSCCRSPQGFARFRYLARRRRAVMSTTWSSTLLVRASTSPLMTSFPPPVMVTPAAQVQLGSQAPDESFAWIAGPASALSLPIARRLDRLWRHAQDRSEEGRVRPLERHRQLRRRRGVRDDVGTVEVVRVGDPLRAGGCAGLVSPDARMACPRSPRRPPQPGRCGASYRGSRSPPPRRPSRTAPST